MSKRENLPAPVRDLVERYANSSTPEWERANIEMSLVYIRDTIDAVIKHVAPLRRTKGK